MKDIVTVRLSCDTVAAGTDAVKKYTTECDHVLEQP